MDNPVWRKRPLSVEKLCKRAEDFLCEMARIRAPYGGDTFSHMQAVFYLMEAVHTLLDRPKLTPEAMRWAYSRTRHALDELGFTREREQEMKDEGEERMADVNFLKEQKICVPDNLLHPWGVLNQKIEPEEM